jgi:hypothetical protein
MSKTSKLIGDVLKTHYAPRLREELKAHGLPQVNDYTQNMVVTEVMGLVEVEQMTMGIEDRWIIHAANNVRIEIMRDGQQLWYQNGKRHREDGPASIWPSGRVEYWMDDMVVRPHSIRGELK